MSESLAHWVLGTATIALWCVVFFFVYRFSSNPKMHGKKYPGGAISITTIITIVLCWCVWFIAHEILHIKA